MQNQEEASSTSVQLVVKEDATQSSSAKPAEAKEIVQQPKESEGAKKSNKSKAVEDRVTDSRTDSAAS